MITEEHLAHWLREITYQLNGIIQEIKAEKVQMLGINVGKTGEVFVSFEYLQEKSHTIKGTIDCILYDIEHDMEHSETILKELRYRKQHPVAFNYAQFEFWINDILKGGHGFPTVKDIIGKCKYCDNPAMLGYTHCLKCGKKALE